MYNYLNTKPNRIFLNHTYDYIFCNLKYSWNKMQNKYWENNVQKNFCCIKCGVLLFIESCNCTLENLFVISSTTSWVRFVYGAPKNPFSCLHKFMYFDHFVSVSKTWAHPIIMSLLIARVIATLNLWKKNLIYYKKNKSVKYNVIKAICIVIQ